MIGSAGPVAGGGGAASAPATTRAGIAAGAATNVRPGTPWDERAFRPSPLTQELLEHVTHPVEVLADQPDQVAAHGLIELSHHGGRHIAAETDYVVGNG